MDALFGVSKTRTLLNAIYKAEKSQDIINVWLKEESHIQLGWLEGE